MREDKVTAACFASDENAAFVLGALVRKGVAIPDDLSITGFEGLLIGEALVPPLATLRMPAERMVARACDILNGKTDQRRNCFRLDLLERGSLGPVRQRL